MIEKIVMKDPILYFHFVSFHIPVIDCDMKILNRKFYKQTVLKF